MTYFHPSRLACKAAGRAVRPLIKLASQRNEVNCSVRSYTVAHVKDQSGAESRQEESGEAPINICLEENWQV